jgi:two-component system, sensor histidine kinase and response regulator
MMPLMMLMSQSTEPTLSRPRVLVIEDDPDARQRLQAALERDYRLQVVGSSLEALELLRKEIFDLVLVDILLPDMAEMELLNRIRAISLTADVPVMLISPRATDQAILQGLQHGANDYITRPFDMEVVRVRIKNQLALKKRLDEQQQTIAMLKTRDEIKDRFLRIATHDLKNPLNNILLAQYQLRNVVGDDPNAAEALDTIEDTVHSMSDLVEDYLDSAALETGYPELKLELIEVEDVISEVVLRYSMIANRKNIAIVVGKASGLVLADHDRLVQILNNLISNAVKFSSPDSTVTVCTELRGSMIRLQVVDHGPGIPQAERQSLFKPFSKLSPRPTGGESSSGLGLWIVKELATLQNGAVGMDCPPEGGSVFWVELPAPAVA